MTAADKIAEAPQRIFAEMEPYDFPGYSPAWVWHSAGEPIEEPGGVVAYVRSDLADALAQENAKLKAIIAAMDGAAPLADKTCDEPGITLSEAVQREWPQLRISPTPSPEPAP